MAALLEDEPPAPPPVAPTPPAAPPVPASITRPRFIDLPVPLPEGAQESLPMRFAWIPPGEFLMGDEKYDDEKPVRRVTIRKGFYMGIFPVTQEQWHCVMNYNASLQVQSSLPGSLERTLYGQSFLFEDAIGRTCPVHLQFVNSWEIFDTVIELRFKECAG